MGILGGVVQHHGHVRDSPGWTLRAVVATFPLCIKEWFDWLLPLGASFGPLGHPGWRSVKTVSPVWDLLNRVDWNKETATKEADLLCELASVRRPSCATGDRPIKWPLDPINVVYVALVRLIQEKLRQNWKNEVNFRQLSTEAEGTEMPTAVTKTVNMRCPQLQQLLKEIEKVAVRNLYEGNAIRVSGQVRGRLRALRTKIDPKTGKSYHDLVKGAVDEIMKVLPVKGVKKDFNGLARLIERVPWELIVTSVDECPGSLRFHSFLTYLRSHAPDDLSQEIKSISGIDELSGLYERHQVLFWGTMHCARIYKPHLFKEAESVAYAKSQAQAPPELPQASRAALDDVSSPGVGGSPDNSRKRKASETRLFDELHDRLDFFRTNPYAATPH